MKNYEMQGRLIKDVYTNMYSDYLRHRNEVDRLAFKMMCVWKSLNLLLKIKLNMTALLFSVRNKTSYRKEKSVILYNMIGNK